MALLFIECQRTSFLKNTDACNALDSSSHLTVSPSVLMLIEQGCESDIRDLGDLDKMQNPGCHLIHTCFPPDLIACNTCAIPRTDCICRTALEPSPLALAIAVKLALCPADYPIFHGITSSSRR